MNLERNTTVNCFRTKCVGGSFIWGTGRGLRVIADRRFCGNVLHRAFTDKKLPTYSHTHTHRHTHRHTHTHTHTHTHIYIYINSAQVLMKGTSVFLLRKFVIIIIIIIIIIVNTISLPVPLSDLVCE